MLTNAATRGVLMRLGFQSAPQESVTMAPSVAATSASIRAATRMCAPAVINSPRRDEGHMFDPCITHQFTAPLGAVIVCGMRRSTSSRIDSVLVHAQQVQRIPGSRLRSVLLHVSNARDHDLVANAARRSTDAGAVPGHSGKECRGKVRRGHADGDRCLYSCHDLPDAIPCARHSPFAAVCGATRVRGGRIPAQVRAPSNGRTFVSPAVPAF